MKVMIIENDMGPSIYLDVSTKAKYEKALKFYIKNSSFTEYMYENYQDGLEAELEMDGCGICDGAGIVKIKHREFTCPECKGRRPSKKEQKEWQEFKIKVKEVEKGNISAIKYMMKYYDEEPQIVNVKVL